MAETTTQRLTLAPEVDLGALLGRNDENLRLLEAELALRIVARGNEITLRGDERQVARGARIVEELLARMGAGLPVQSSDVRAALRVLADDADADLKSIFLDAIPVPSRKKQITPKTLNQKRYVEAIRSHDIVVGIGPAGTGKSYLAMAMAVSALTRREVARIILTRPAVEAGERLGFLPGDMYEKVHPYLRPLYDALYDMMEPDKAATMTERGAIEIAPLAYMRGRTLNDAFIVLDEAQNTTSEQMKMFLTRLGFNSRMVITGDITQVDLPSSRPSGLIEIQSVLKSIAGIRFVYFTEKDVVRHELVSDDRARLRRVEPAARDVIVVANRQSLPVDLRRIRRTLRTALRALGVWDHELSLTLVDDRTIRALNARYRGVRRRTDVLAFPLAGPAAVVGEAIISVETARRQARTLGHSLREELDLLCCHACLHLIGYDDRAPLEARLMHAREMDLLGKLYERPARTLHVGA